ncbi:TetR family transcriptional regulator [Ideonella livida]|uniref:TetR family transcriptional regulator n=1 Tax=Ideonella livida TaxID=2707176 RepID=A0A7C9PHR2_9BURK|nr:TetR family transcriptional regulator [Ideonella livida]NDY92293.1 TetR family transcriptional regulator [Ideonella livida]
MVRKTKAEALETRHQILDAAEQVFLRQGVSGTSLQDIAVAAGVTRGAVYWHFENKAAVFHAMMERVVLPCESAMCELEAAPADAVLDTLCSLAMGPLQELAGKPQVQRVFTIAIHLTEYTGEMKIEQDQHRDSIQRYLGQMEGLLARAQQSGSLGSHLAPRTAALGLFSLVDGLMMHWTLAPDSFDLVQVGQQTIHSYLAGLRSAR